MKKNRKIEKQKTKEKKEKIEKQRKKRTNEKEIIYARIIR